MIAQMRRQFPVGHIYLGGHSSGAGYLLNAYPHPTGKSHIAGMIFLAPEFGFRAGANRAGVAFARTKIWPFVINAMSGGRIAGGFPAVFFNNAAAGPNAGLLAFYSVNLANAITPENPGVQLRGIDVPLQIFYASEDELIDPQNFVVSSRATLRKPVLSSLSVHAISILFSTPPRRSPRRMPPRPAALMLAGVPGRRTPDLGSESPTGPRGNGR